VSSTNLRRSIQNCPAARNKKTERRVRGGDKPRRAGIRYPRFRALGPGGAGGTCGNHVGDGRVYDFVGLPTLHDAVALPESDAAEPPRVRPIRRRDWAHALAHSRTR